MERMESDVEISSDAVLKVPEIFWIDSEFDVMTPEQETFYRTSFIPGLRLGEPVNVQKQSGYGSAYVDELVVEYKTDPIRAKETLARLLDAYTGADRPSNAQTTLASFHFLEGNYAAGYETLGTLITPELHLNLAEVLENPRLNAEVVWRWSAGGITQKGYKYLREIFRLLQDRLDDFHDAHGKSILVDFWERAAAKGTVEEVARTVELDVFPRLTGSEVRYFLGKACAEEKEHNLLLKESSKDKSMLVNWRSPGVARSYRFGLVVPLLWVYVRETENMVRAKSGIPKVGEGLVSEMTLLREIQSAFPNDRIVHQARPAWLAPQSLDIYLPDHNIGIEYQGTQHSKPVDFFGGIDAFEDQKRRDAMKAGLCDENGCALIEVFPGYGRQEVILQVQKAILRTSESS